MKKTWIVELFANIKETLVSFISIMIFVALGVGVFLGMSFASSAATNSMEQATIDARMHDIQIIYPYGFSDEDIENISKLDNVDEIKGIYTGYAYFDYEGSKYQVELIETQDDMDIPIYTEGILPSKYNEIGIDKLFADTHGIKIGDILTLNTDSELTTEEIVKVLGFDEKDINIDNYEILKSDNSSYLKTNTFTVTGIFSNAEFLCLNTVCYGVSSTNHTSIDCFAYLSEDAFNKDVFLGYPKLLIRSNKLRNSTSFDKTYQEVCDEIVEQIDNNKAIEIANNRYATIINKIDSTYSSFDSKLKDIKKQIEDGSLLIDDNKQELISFRNQLQDAKKELEEAQNKVNSGWQEANDAEDEIEKNKETLDTIKSVYDTTCELLKQFNYIIDNFDSITTKIETLYSKYSVVENKIREKLPEDSVVLDIIKAIHAKLYEDITDQEKIAYVATKIAELKEGIDLNDTISDLRDYWENLEEGETKDKLDDFILDLETFNEFLKLSPKEFMAMYELFKKTGALDAYDKQAYEEIMAAITETGLDVVPLKTYFESIVSKISAGYTTIADNFDNIYMMLKMVEPYSKSIYTELIANEYRLTEKYNELYKAIEELEDAKNKLYDAQEQIDNGWVEYRNNYSKLNTYYNELTTKEKELYDAQTQYNTATKELDEFSTYKGDVKEYGYATITRVYNPGLVVGRTIGEMLNKLRYNMAILFLLVGLLVCYSAISRIVNNQTKRIGAKKALGLTKVEITLSYLSYTGMAIVVGCIAGNLLGYFVVENILVKTLSENYACKFSMYFSLKESLLICAIEAIALELATYFACSGILSRSAIKLLNDVKETRGKQRFFEKFKIWENTSLYTKTIINNFLNDPKRAFGTIVGIAGSTALIVTALTLNDNVNDSFKVQYNDYFHDYDSIVYFDSNYENAENDIEDVLIDENIKFAPVYTSRIFLKNSTGHYIASALTIPEDYESFNELIYIDPVTDYNTDTNKGLWLSASYYNYFNPAPEDKISLITVDGEHRDVVPAGYFNFHLSDYQIFVDKDTYRDNFGVTPKSNAFFFSSKDVDVASLINKLKTIDGFTSVQDYYEVSRQSFNAFQSVSTTLVILYTSLSVLMIFLVSLNVLILFIEEKRYELIVLMINGYTRKEAKKYIYLDTIFLSIISILLGCVIGSIVGNNAVSSFEAEAMSLIHKVDINACLIGASATASLTLIVSIIALKRIDRFKLSDINKA